MKRWRREENDRMAEKKRWRLGEWRRVGWWFRRERERGKKIKRERETSALGFVERERIGLFTNLICGERVRKPLGCVNLNT